jgi:AcrR family transcriptional regulator
MRQEDSRANQKARTRAAIVEAALQLHRAGATPTVAQAAAQARVSRATAYRYFPTQEALLVELAVTPGVARVEEMLADLSTDDAEQRLHQLLDLFGPIVIAEEAQLRRALYVYLDTWLRSHRHPDAEAPAVREGRRMRWLDQVLEPLPSLSAAQRRRLQAALALTLGIDSVVIMKDVCGLDDAEALAVLRWTATTLLRAALVEHPSVPTPPALLSVPSGAPAQDDR